MKAIFLGALGALLLALAPIQEPRADTVTLTDVLGREVEVPSHAERILLGFYYEDFYAVAGPKAYDRVVAISRETWEGWRNFQWRAYVAADPRLETLADIGGVEGGTFALEAVIAAKPDLAILSAWQFSAIGDAAARLEAAGIPVVVIDYNAQTVERHVASTRILGRIMGAEDRAERLATEYAAAVADVERRVAAALAAGAARPRTYVELGRKGPDEFDRAFATAWDSAGAITTSRRLALWIMAMTASSVATVNVRSSVAIA